MPAWRPGHAPNRSCPIPPNKLLQHFLQIPPDTIPVRHQTGELLLAHIAEASEHLPVHLLLVLEDTHRPESHPPALELEEADSRVPHPVITWQGIYDKRPVRPVHTAVNRILGLRVVLWVAPRKILGGNCGLGGYVPIGWQEISIDVDAVTTLTTRNGRTFQRGASFSLGEESTEIGDPALMPMLGWHSGNWHWNMTGLLNIPVGQYDKNDIANMGVNRWAFDATGATTWMDPQRGHEVSVAAGFTFNGENPDTKYRTGTEFHAEFAIMQHVSEAFAFGIAGYHYQQVTGDSGAGATLGAFKGRVTALGPNVVYNLKLGATPIATQLRWYHEFNVKNRVQGDAVLFSVSIALGGKQ